MKMIFGASAAMLAMLSGCGEQGQDATASAGSAVSLAAFTRAPADTSTVGCQSRSARYPWGKADLRSWTPTTAVAPANPNASPGSVYGAAFTARLVEAYGLEYGEARRTVILEMADGCRRQYRTESLSDADNALIDAEIAKRPIVNDPATYRVAYQNGLTSPDLVASGELHLLETQHFAFWYGNGWDDNYDFARTIAAQGRTKEQVLEETAAWFERIWYINRDAIGAPMPFAAATDKRKLNVYLCGTGRPNANGDTDECGAGAGEAMGISAWALAKGSNVITHEFGHMIQFYTGGFRDRPNAGPIWETGAEWNAVAVNPSFNTAFFYFDNLENGPIWSVSRYAAHPFMAFLYETDRTRKLVFDAWKTSVQQGAFSSVTRDFVETLVALGQRTGAYPRGYASFADDMGWYGARLATMDFLNQRTLFDAHRPTRASHNMGHFYTPLVASGGNAYASPGERALLQWGTHLIPLTGSAPTVKVTLTGATKANSAAWRFSIVSVKGEDQASYSALGRAEGTGSGTVSIATTPGARLYLAVTATPYRYESNGWQDLGQPVKGTRFPYKVTIEGARPRTGDVRACDPESAEGTWGANYTLNGNTDQTKPCA